MCPALHFSLSLFGGPRSLATPMTNHTQNERLSRVSRCLCAAGALGALLVLVAAYSLFPLMWRSERLAPYIQQPCMLRETTGIPCPFCGATRSVVAAARGDLVKSLRLSLLGMPAILLSAGALLWLGICAITGRDLLLRRVGNRLESLPVLRILLGIFVLTWGYEILVDCVLHWH